MKNLLTIGLMSLASLGAWAQTQGEKNETTQAEASDSVALEARMQDIAITAQRQLVRQDVDSIFYDVAADEDSRTLSVLDMLRKVPYVTVDGNDNILVKGGSAFRVYKNGRPDPALTKNAKEILRAMPASMVRRIEVVTSPGAKEDAEGVQAILNIVLKDNGGMEGVTGSISANINTLLHPNAGAYVMTQAGPLTVSANYGYGGMSKRETEGRYEGHIDYAATGHHVESDSRQRSPGSVHYANVDVSLELDTLNLISASMGGYFHNLNVQGDSHWAMTDGAGAPLYSYSSHFWMPDYLHHSWQGRADYERRTRRKDERWTLSYMLALTRQHIDDETTYSDLRDVPFAYTGLMSRSKERFTEHTWQLDWLRPLAKGHQLETGGKYICRLNSSRNTQEFYGPAAATSAGLDTTRTTFRHRTHVAALYGDYAYRSEALSLKAGLRYEYARMSGNGVHRRLHDLVPRAALLWQMSARHSLKAEYVTTIRRPGIDYLNPAVEVAPFRVSQGNPALKSSRHQSTYLIYMYMGRRLTLNLAPAWKWSRDGIGTVLTAQGDVHHQTYGNAIGHRRLQLEGYVQWKPWDKTTLTLNANLGHDRYVNATSGLRLSRFSGFVYGYVQQKLWWRLLLTLAGYGQVGHAIAGVYGYDDPWWAGSMSLQRSFLRGDRLSVRLSADLPFTTFKRNASHQIQGDYTQVSRQHTRSRAFLLSLTYRFGSLKATVRKAETSIENDDLVGGISRQR